MMCNDRDDDDAGAGQTGPARRGFEIDGEDVPDRMTEAWITRPDVPAWCTSAEWDKDDPEALRAAGPVAVGNALARWIEDGQMSVYRDVRELAALVRQWVEEDLGRFDHLDVDLGLRPRDGRRPLADIARRAERDRLVVALARQAPYASMTSRAAAVALRAACQRYQGAQWPRDKVERKGRPQGEAAVWWQVMQLGLDRPMPSPDTLAARIRQDRGGREPQLSLPL